MKGVEEMKCSKCGAELASGAQYCRECGAKVDAKKRFCRECGSELSADAKFCSKCGAKVLGLNNAETEKEADNAKSRETQDASECSCSNSTASEARTPTVASNAGEEKSSTLGARVKKSILSKWRKLNLFCKSVAISSIVIFILTVVAVCTGKVLPIVLSFLQIAAIVVAILIHKGVIRLGQKSSWLKWLILAAAILFAALNIMSYSWKSTAPATGQSPSSTNQNSGDKAEKIDWKNITLSKVLPEPQSNMMEILYNGEDWLNVTVYDISKNDFLEYVRWCKDDYGFTVNSDSFNDYFYAYNQDGYGVTLFYTETSCKLEIDLNAPTGTVMTDPNSSTGTQQPEPTESPKDDASNTLSITKGTEYAYMTDEWNVYIATAISDKIIKVANWDKTMSSSKSVAHDYDVGTFKINDSENGFAWVDDEHTAFVLSFKDKNNSKFKKGGTATFTINISDSDKNKGSNYSKDIACFSYQNDDWHLYRAIPLTETLIKIETWYRGSSAGTFLFGYDLRLIDTASGDTDFEWTDNEHTSFSITMRDEKNKYEWKDESFVVFILENEDYTYFDVKSYLGKWEIGDGEAAVPASASDYKYKNYQDVQKDLEDAGFTNITAEILYDIVLGWTKEGEVKSVSIEGRTDYEKGEVFNMNAPIVITYHMKEADDPSKVAVEKASEVYVGKNYLEVKQAFENMGFTNIVLDSVSTTSSSYTDGAVSSVKIDGSPFNAGDKFKPNEKVSIKYYHLVPNTETTQPKTYSVDKDLVVTQCERDAKYRTMYHITFAEIDSNGNQIREYTFGHCVNPRAMGKNFNAIGDFPAWFYVGATVHVRANLGYDGLSETDTFVSEATGDGNSTAIDSTATVILPEPSSKLGKDFDSKSSTTVFYINVDGIKNKPMIKTWNGATVTDGVAEYLDKLTAEGFNVQITSQDSKSPYSGFTYYETYFDVSNGELSWTMYLNIQSEKYIEYELDINLQ